MIYLDNGATTHKKPFKTIMAIIKALTFYSANPSRGSHYLSIKTGEKVELCREHIKKFVNAPNTATVVYTYNCTEAINFALLGTLNKNDHVIITTFEHNAVLRTLTSLKRNGIHFSVITPTKNGEITIEQINKELNENTKMVVVNETSNVTGTTTKIKPIGEYCKKHNLLFLVDCAQSAGHEKLDMTKNNISYIALAGHKGLYGPQGIGALIINNCEPSPIKFGGSGTDSKDPHMPNYYPEKLEAGTINTVGIIGLDAGITYVEKHFKLIQNKTYKLTKFLLDNLKLNKNIILYSNNPHSGVVSFNLKNLDTQDAVNILNENKICVRGGLHCSPLAHKYLGTLDGGTIRVSISYFNTLSEIKKLIRVINKLSS